MLLKLRLESLVRKIISFKFLMFGITTVLRCCNVIGNGEWLTVTCIVICGREGQKIANGIMNRHSGGFSNEVGG